MKLPFDRRICLSLSIIFLFTLNTLFAQSAPDSAPPETKKAPAKSEKTKAAEAASEAPSKEPAQKEPAQTKRNQPPAATSGAVAVVREPSQGRPIFITPGEKFTFVMSLSASFEGELGFVLVHSLEPTIRVPLVAKTPPTFVSNQYCHLQLQVRQDIAPGLYDIEVTGNIDKCYSRRSVKVISSFKDKFRFVHLSNMNVGDLTAPAFDDYLPREINLLAPEFIVATGDYTEWARALDQPDSWKAVLKFFEAFNAPVFMMCGMHDHRAGFTKYVASDPIGEIDYGNYHGILLFDHPANPIDQDFNQIKWVDRSLKQNRHRRMNFIASNSDELGILDVWRERGDVEQFIKEHKVRLIIAGGSTDWDFREFAGKLEGLDGLHFVRTHQSSTCLRDRATGFSHYRVIEVDGDKLAYTYPNDTAAEAVQHSVPTGRLRAFYDRPNNGRSTRVTATVQNALNQPFDNARLWLRVAKKGEKKPVVKPGRVLEILDAGNHWACDVSIDLPDKGAVRVMASTDDASIPDEIPLKVNLTGSRDLAFSRQVTDFGLTYFESDARLAIELSNTSQSDVECWPVIRLNGGQIHVSPTALSRLPLRLASGETLTLPLDLSLRRVSVGPHKLQVHFLEDPLSRLNVFDVKLSMRDVVTVRDENPS